MYYYIHRHTKAFKTTPMPIENDLDWVDVLCYHTNIFGNVFDKTLSEILQHYNPEEVDKLALVAWLETVEEGGSTLDFVNKVNRFIPSFRLRAAKSMRERLEKALRHTSTPLPHLVRKELPRPNVMSLSDTFNKTTKGDQK